MGLLPGLLWRGFKMTPPVMGCLFLGNYFFIVGQNGCSQSRLVFTSTIKVKSTSEPSEGVFVSTLKPANISLPFPSVLFYLWIALCVSVRERARVRLRLGDFHCLQNWFNRQHLGHLRWIHLKHLPLSQDHVIPLVKKKCSFCNVLVNYDG